MFIERWPKKYFFQLQRSEVIGSALTPGHFAPLELSKNHFVRRSINIYSLRDWGCG